MNRAETDSKYHRQLDIIHPDKLAFPITIIGAGASGSYTALALAKMGCTNITVFDFDTVEPHNQPNQLYGAEYIGQPKVLALNQEIARITGTDILALADGYGTQSFSKSDDKTLVLSCVDSIKVRENVWDQAKKQGSRAAPITVIDPRQGGEFIVIFTAKSHGDLIGAKQYEESLHPDTESMELPCTARAVIYNSMFTGALMAVLVKKFALDEALPREVSMNCSGLALGASV